MPETDGRASAPTRRVNSSGAIAVWLVQSRDARSKFQSHLGQWRWDGTGVNSDITWVEFLALCRPSPAKQG